VAEQSHQGKHSEFNDGATPDIVAPRPMILL
jgi:hypothetical protein